MDVWQAKDLTLAEKFLYAEIAAFCLKNGDCFLSYAHIKEELNVSQRQAQRYISNLVKRGFIAVTDTDGRRQKCRICGDKNVTSDMTKMSPQPRQKCHPEYKNINISTSDEDRYRTIQKEKIKKESFSFRSALIGIGVQPETADAWLLVRKNKRATNTQIAFDAIAKEIRKTGKPADECIRQAVIQSWAGFKAAWMEREQAGFQTAPRRENYVQAGLRVHDELLGTNFMEQYNKLKNGQ